MCASTGIKECCVLCRDDARNVLVAMMAELGVSYLYFAIQVLQNACPAKGYTAHVLGYTLHAILEAVSKVPCHCDPDLLALRHSIATSFVW